MNGFFAILFITGVVSGCERMEVKRGDKVVLVENKSGLENLSRVALYEDNADGKREGKTTDYILNYCSPKENESGCTNKNSSTFSFCIGEDSVSLTPLNASDGYYVASITFGNNNVKKISIVVNGTLPRTISPDPPPSRENPEARETPRTKLSILVIAVVLIIVGIAVCIIASILKSEASDFKKYHIKAGEQTTGDSCTSKMVDRTPPSEDEDSNSPNEVLIHDTSAGQENGRPDDENSKHNNINYNK